MSSSIQMYYGAYEFSPVPFFSYQVNMLRAGSDEKIGQVNLITLRGTLTPLPTDTESNYEKVEALEEALVTALSSDCQLFRIICGATTLYGVYPRVTSVNFESPDRDNAVYTRDFEITMEVEDDNDSSPYLKERSESWSIESDEERKWYSFDLDSGDDVSAYVFRLSHSVSAIGQRVCPSGSATAAWEQARDYCITKIGYDGDQVEQSGVINISQNDFSEYDHFRVVRKDIDGGSYSVDESWILINATGSGVHGKGIEDFEVSINESSQEGLDTVTIQGSIQGLEQRSYGSNPGDYTISTSAYDNALTYWTTVQGKLFDRVNHISSGQIAGSLNNTALNESEGHNPGRGLISYNKTFDTRPCNFVSGSLFESISINDSAPAERFAAITVLGRAQGSILQDLGTKSHYQRTFNIELVVGPPTGCTNIITNIDAAPTGEVQNLVNSIESNLTGNYSQVFKSQDNSSWDIKSGRFTRTATWDYNGC